MPLLSRRHFITSAAATLITAPAIVRAASLMPVKVFEAADFQWSPHIWVFPDNFQVSPTWFGDRLYWVTKDEPQTIQFSKPMDASIWQ